MRKETAEQRIRKCLGDEEKRMTVKKKNFYEREGLSLREVDWRKGRGKKVEVEW